MQKTHYKNIKKLGLLIICFEGSEHLYNIISELRESVDFVSVGLQRLSYHGDRISQIDLNEIFRLRDEDHLVDNILEVELDINKAAREQETDKRNMLIQDAQDHGCTHAIVIDSDEYYTRKSFENACQMIDDNNYPITYCQYINYYHDYNHFLLYPFKDGMYVPFVTRVEYRHSFECTDFTLPSDPTRRFVRPVKGMKKVKDELGREHEIKEYAVDYHVFQWNEVKMHHLSWLRADIRKKLNVWSSKKCFDNYNDLIDKAVASFKKFDENSIMGTAQMLFNTPGNKVNVKKFPKQYIHPSVDFITRLRPTKNYKKLLVLSMSADSELFNNLEEVSNRTWRNIDTEKYKNIDVQFWTYTDAKPNQKTSVDTLNHIIYIEKDPNKDWNYRTYSKTIFAIRELKKLGIDYDYIIRTNNSTWINIPLINEFLAYQEDDSQLFVGRVYSAFWSAFNLYGGGELLCLHKRNIDILDSMSPDPKAVEDKIQGCDDNIIGGLWNQRLINLGLAQTEYIHSLEDEMFYEIEIPNDIDFTHVAYQIKTYHDLSDELSFRIKYDVKKMEEVDRQWRNNNNSIDDLYKKMLEYYDKNVYVINVNKQTWLNKLSGTQQGTLKFKSGHSREEGIKLAQKLQKENGYTIALK